MKYIHENGSYLEADNIWSSVSGYDHQWVYFAYMAKLVTLFAWSAHRRIKGRTNKVGLPESDM